MRIGTGSSRGRPTRSRSIVAEGLEASRNAASASGAAHRACAAATITPRDAILASRMDPAHSPLTGLVDASPRAERFRAFADDFPANARVSEAGPRALSSPALHVTLGRPLVVPPRRGRGGARSRRGGRLVRRSGRASRLLPSRGVHAGSGLEPPAHLVGEARSRLQQSNAAGLVCVSARCARRGASPREARPRCREPQSL